MSIVKSGRGRFALRTAACALAVLLVGCATTAQYREANRLFEQGQYVEAVQKYRDASQARPYDVEFRKSYLFKRGEALDILLGRADRARQAGQFKEAETLYRQALQIDPQSPAASEGFRRIADARRHHDELVEVDELIAAGKLDPAERKVQAVLAEAPDDERARNSLDRIRAARSQERKEAADGLDARFHKPVTLEFRDVPAKTVFDVLSKASGINFIYDQDIRPDLKVSVFLRKTPMEEAIRLIGLSAQLETRVLNANSVLVYPNTPQKIGEYRQLDVRTFYLANADAKKVAEMLKTVLKAETLAVDEKLNMLIMRDSPDAIRLAERLVALADIGEPEVMLDVEVLEVKTSRLLDMGLSLPSEIALSVVPPSQTGATAVPIDTLRHLNGSNIYATVPNVQVKLRDEGSDARTLANPKIRVKSKEKASVLIGDKVPVITSTSTSTGFVSETVNYVDVGLKLEVEPSVYTGDEVSIKINLEVSSLVREITTASGTLSYQIGTRNAQTVLRLRDGETQILAGLINKEDRKSASGLPFISRFPLLDRLFGAKKDDRQNTEIVLSITPHLIRGVRRASMQELQFETGSANHLRGTPASAGAPASEESPEAAAGAPDAVAVPTGAESADDRAGTDAQPNVSLAWSAPGQVAVGEQFTAVLNVTALKAIDQLPLMIGFDPKTLQVVSIEEGQFMSQGGGHSALTKEVNLSNGKITATVARQGTAVSGQGTLLQVTFRALAPADRTSIRVLSAAPAPEQSGPARLADLTVKVQ